jgi:hypothetical protein
MPDHSRFPALATALQIYARVLTKAPVVRLKFELEPGVPDPGLESCWVARALLTGHDLKVPKPDGPEADFLDGAETMQVTSSSWEGRGDTFDDAVEDLAKQVNSELVLGVTKRQEELALAESAQRALQSPAGLEALWPTEDVEAPADPR